MSFIEPLLVLMLLSSMVWAAVGWLYSGALGASQGALFGLLVWPALFGLSLAFAKAWGWLFPRRPRCARDACGDSDYSYVAHSDTLGRLLVCRCGGTYAQVSSEADRAARFVRVVDGQSQPYMIRRSLRWRPEARATGSPYR
jgi:hypothetical protein